MIRALLVFAILATAIVAWRNLPPERLRGTSCFGCSDDGIFPGGKPAPPDPCSALPDTLRELPGIGTVPCKISPTRPEKDNP